MSAFLILMWLADIAGNIGVVAVFDDRDRLVKMWRSVGVVCLQVADGDF